MEVRKVAVVGAGNMGRQIALNSAIYPFAVYVTDNVETTLNSVRKWVEEYLEGRVKKGRMTQEQIEDIKKRFHITGSLEEAINGADLVIEAIVERESAKHDLFKKINEIAREDTILATNSSYMVSSLFKDDVCNPSRLCNMHYFAPALVMKLVEVVRGEHTSDKTISIAYDFCKKTGKTPIIVEREIYGFIVNRILDAYVNEARKLVDEGYCSYQDMDIACENGLGHPMGPFRLSDLTGIDLNIDVMESRYQETGIKPPGYDLFKKMYDQGRYGKKVGRGFYDYE